jgi:cobalamin biosynthesis protein CbiD
MEKITDLKGVVELILSIATIIGFVYKIAQLENAIYSKIDKVNDYARESIIKIQAHDEMVDYKINNLFEKLNTIEDVLTKIHGNIKR